MILSEFNVATYFTVGISSGGIDLLHSMKIGSEYNQEKQPQLLSVALQDSAIIQKIAGSSPGSCGRDGGRTNYYLY